MTHHRINDHRIFNQESGSRPWLSKPSAENGNKVRDIKMWMACAAAALIWLALFVALCRN